MPLPEKDVTTMKRQAEAAPLAIPALTVSPTEPGKDQTNVGNKLLKIMGWKEGTGLGSEADGRVNPMFVDLFISLPHTQLSNLLVKLQCMPPVLG